MTSRLCKWICYSSMQHNSIKTIWCSCKIFYSSHTRTPTAYKPKLHELQTLTGRGEKTVQIITTVAGDWKTLALALHFEGTDIQRIQTNTHHQADSAATEVLQEWLKGRGRKPVNWSTLIAALVESKLSELANEVEEALLET